MGIDFASARKLIQLSAKWAGKGSVLMLGRQKMAVRAPHRPAIDAILANCGFDGLTYADLSQPDGYAETFFAALGHGRVQTMDMSDYEGADIIHDLNTPLRVALQGKFDLVFDGGTTEHVFDVATCMDNINRLVAPNGIFASAVPANGWFAHGFYQFGPELVYGYWRHGCGYDVRRCLMLPQLPRDKEVAIADPTATGKRPQFVAGVPDQKLYLYYEVQKGPRAHLCNGAFQTDYVNDWSRHDLAQERDGSDNVALRNDHLSRT